MPKMKTRKTLKKRLKITSTGKLLKKQVRMGHLKRKFDASRKSRKKHMLEQKNIGHVRILRKLLGK